MNNYSQVIIENFLNPKNVGEICNADAVGESGNPDNGNYMKLWVQIDTDGIISNITFKTVGCVPAIAAGSIITQLALHRPIDAAQTIDMNTLLNAMGGLPQDKFHTARLALNALRDALTRYAKRQ